jgi:hypothetical protein
MTKVNEHSLPDAKPAAPIYRHSSETARSQNDAGGKISVDQYIGKVPGLDPKKV